MSAHKQKNFLSFSRPTLRPSLSTEGFTFSTVWVVWWSKNVEHPRASAASHLFFTSWTQLRVDSRAHLVPRLAPHMLRLDELLSCRFTGNATCFVSWEWPPPTRRGPSGRPSGPDVSPLQHIQYAAYGADKTDHQRSFGFLVTPYRASRQPPCFTAGILCVCLIYLARGPRNMCS